MTLISRLLPTALFYRSSLLSRTLVAQQKDQDCPYPLTARIHGSSSLYGLFPQYKSFADSLNFACSTQKINNNNCMFVIFVTS